jgi:phage-related baseplate assembly protein
MPFEIPTTEQQKAINLANLEGELNQTTPLNDKAFNRVLAAAEAIAFTSLFKYASYQVKQVLAITAFGTGLDIIGTEYGVVRKAAEATVLTATLPGTNSTIIPQTVDFIGDANGVRYFLDSNVEIGAVVSGIGEMILTAETPGTVGNLQAGDTLSIGTQIAGAETIATVALITGYTDVIINTGAEEETDEAYRARVLSAIREVRGGGNAADYRSWSEEVAGVERAYPYSGQPTDTLLDSSPPERTVYIEATTTVDADGIAPQSLLNEVRQTITTDPVTSEARQPLGLTDETLFVETIERTGFFITIVDLSVSSDIEAQVKDDIETALTNYFLTIKPFVDGLDSEIDRNDKITDLTISNVVQDVLSANGGTANGVAFDITPATSIPEYTLSPGELAKLASGGITYV